MNTSSSTFQIVLGLLLGFCSLYTIYFNFVRSVLVTRFRFTIAEARDDAHTLLLSGKLSPTDPGWEILRRRIQKAEAWLEGITVTDMLLALSRGHLRSMAAVNEENATIRASIPELAAISSKLDLAVVGSFAANSPLVLGSAVITIFGAAVWSWMALSAKRTLTARFWDVLYLQGTRSRSAELAQAC